MEMVEIMKVEVGVNVWGLSGYLDDMIILRILEFVRFLF